MSINDIKTTQGISIWLRGTINHPLNQRTNPSLTFVGVYGNTFECRLSPHKTRDLQTHRSMMQ